MSEHEDTEGRHFDWICRSGFPLEVGLLASGQEVGTLRKPTNNRGLWNASFGGIDWTLSFHSGLVHRFNISVGFRDGPVLGEGNWSLDGLGRLLLDGVRPYQMVKSSSQSATWSNLTDQEQAVLRVPWRFSRNVATGHIEIVRTCPAIDIPALLLVGVALVYEVPLFRLRPEFRLSKRTQ